MLTEKELKIHVSSGPLLPSIVSSRYNMEIHSCMITFFPCDHFIFLTAAALCGAWHCSVRAVIYFFPKVHWASLVAQTVKNLPVMQETQVRSLGHEPLEKGMGTHSCVLAREIPWTEEPGRLWSMGS